MSISVLPISDTITAESEAHVAEFIKSVHNTNTAVYPIGGGTSLNLGLPAKHDGVALQTTELDQVVDYPARDMTITVGSGIRIEHLQTLLAKELQRLPIDAPQASEATLGGVIASNHSGPSRYGHGTMRDHVIGIRAVDGTGCVFAAGGRVVKNVAGYDFCKLLTGSMGTLGVITEVTLKLRPIPAAKAFVICQPRDGAQTERILAGLIDFPAVPNIIDTIQGAGWELPGLDAASGQAVIVGLEGTNVEVDWMIDTLQSIWKSQQLHAHVIRGKAYDAIYRQLVDFPADDAAAMVIKMTCLPSRVTDLCDALAREDGVRVQAHAGNGIIIAKFNEYPGSATRFKSLAATASGSATILSNPSGAEMTHHNAWGTADVPFDVMKRVKDAFDPNHILNPGRFVY